MIRKHLDKAATARKTGAEAHDCVCGQWGAFGLGWPIQARQDWFCKRHLPSDYWSRK